MRGMSGFGDDDRVHALGFEFGDDLFFLYGRDVFVFKENELAGRAFFLV